MGADSASPNPQGRPESAPAQRSCAAEDKPPQGQNQSPQLLLDRVGVAYALGISIRALDKLRARGALPAPVRLGRSVRWSRLELGAWIAAGCPAATLWERLGRGNEEQS